MTSQALALNDNLLASPGLTWPTLSCSCAYSSKLLMGSARNLKFGRGQWGGKSQDTGGAIHFLQLGQMSILYQLCALRRCSGVQEQSPWLGGHGGECHFEVETLSFCTCNVSHKFACFFMFSSAKNLEYWCCLAKILLNISYFGMVTRGHFITIRISFGVGQLRGKGMGGSCPLPLFPSPLCRHFGCL